MGGITLESQCGYAEHHVSCDNTTAVTYVHRSLGLSMSMRKTYNAVTRLVEQTFPSQNEAKKKPSRGQ